MKPGRIFRRSTRGQSPNQIQSRHWAIIGSDAVAAPILLTFVVFLADKLRPPVSQNPTISVETGLLAARAARSIAASQEGLEKSPTTGFSDFFGARFPF